MFAGNYPDIWPFIQILGQPGQGYVRNNVQTQDPTQTLA